MTTSLNNISYVHVLPPSNDSIHFNQCRFHRTTIIQLEIEIKNMNLQEYDDIIETSKFQ